MLQDNATQQDVNGTCSLVCDLYILRLIRGLWRASSSQTVDDAMNRAINAHRDACDIPGQGITMISIEDRQRLDTLLDEEYEAAAQTNHRAEVRRLAELIGKNSLDIEDFGNESKYRAYIAHHERNAYEAIAGIAGQGADVSESPSLRHFALVEGAISKFCHWIEVPDIPRKIHWFHGASQSGKTTMISTLLKKANSRGLACAGYSFDAAVDWNTHFNDFVLALLRQVADTRSSFKQAFVKSFKKHTNSGSITLNASHWSAQADFMAQMYAVEGGMTEEARSEEIVFFIDDIDRYYKQGAVVEFLRFVTALTDRSLPFTFVVTSSTESLEKALADQPGCARMIVKNEVIYQQGAMVIRA